MALYAPGRSGMKYEAGCDEAGRGCLAGPVFAAAVILPGGYRNRNLNDSKLVDPATRVRVAKQIRSKALAWAIGLVGPEEIDRINILQASMVAMHRALDQLTIDPEHIYIDGNYWLPYGNTPHECVVRGDSTYMSIAAASILAKVYRDRYMMDLHEQFPDYNWYRNKGYPTMEHRVGIQRCGLSPLHRRSFTWKLTQEQLEFWEEGKPISTSKEV